MLVDRSHRADATDGKEFPPMFRVLDWNFSGTAEPVVASLLLATLVLSIVLL
jgi:hypothetical protein